MERPRTTGRSAGVFRYRCDTGSPRLFVAAEELADKIAPLGRGLFVPDQSRSDGVPQIILNLEF